MHACRWHVAEPSSILIRQWHSSLFHACATCRAIRACSRAATWSSRTSSRKRFGTAAPTFPPLPQPGRAPTATLWSGSAAGSVHSSSYLVQPACHRVYHMRLPAPPTSPTCAPATGAPRCATMSRPIQRALAVPQLPQTPYTGVPCWALRPTSSKRSGKATESTVRACRSQ
jgi:hypothetical protein